jgi:hypothetical protein
MGKTYRKSSKDDKEQEIFIRSKRRAEPDLRALARALIQIAQAEVEAENAHRNGETLLVEQEAARSKPRSGNKAAKSSLMSSGEVQALNSIEVSP